MILGTAITQGYQRVISHKFYDCWGHLHITNFLPDPSNLLNDEKMVYDEELMREVKKTPHVKRIFPYSIQSSIAKSNKEMEGVLLKGIQNQESLQYFSSYLVEGKNIKFDHAKYSNEILISSTLAKTLGLSIGDALMLYFLNKNEYQPKQRKVVISGIFNTGLEDYDKLFAICDAKLIHSVNDDSTSVIQGYEIYLDNYKNAKLVEHDLIQHTIQSPLEVYPLEQRFANIFSWLGLMKTNEIVIITIMMIIAIMNIITVFLVLIMERTQMIGVLKSIGMANKNIMQIFLYSSLFVVGLGTLIGTCFATLLCIGQAQFGWIHLPEASYYIKEVPIYLKLSNVLLIDLGTIMICLLLLFIPLIIIRTISPSKALLFN